MFTDTPFIIRIAMLLTVASFAACDNAVGGADDVQPDVASEQQAVTTEDSGAGRSIYQLTGTWHDQHGDSLALGTMAGRVRVVAMVYTNCHSSCPLIIADMKRIEASLTERERSQVGFVLVSLDPARDTPAQLAEWAGSIGLDDKYYTLLSGSDGAVRELSAALDVRYQTQQNGELAHTNGLSILDRDGNIAHQQIGLGETPASIDVIKSLAR